MSRSKCGPVCSCAGRSPDSRVRRLTLWIPASTGTRSSANERGFTLIELLVALTIFAMLSAAGVMLLGNAVSAQGQVAEHLDEQSGMLRVAALIEQDMSEAMPRISRTENGLLAPAFFSRPSSESEPLLQFVRGGWINLDDAARPDMQKVEYWLRDGKLERRTYPMVDGAAGGEPALLIGDVEQVDLGFRDGSGTWIDQWQSHEPQSMPSAVRFTINRRGEAPLTLQFRVGLGKADPVKEEDGDA